MARERCEDPVRGIECAGFHLQRIRVRSGRFQFIGEISNQPGGVAVGQERRNRTHGNRPLAEGIDLEAQTFE